MLQHSEQFLLAIDAGNTNTVFALFAGDQLAAEFRHETNPNATGDDLAVWLSQLLILKNFSFGMIGATVIASVVPALDYSLRSFVRSYLQHEPLFITHDLTLGFDIQLPEPAQLGADRLANAAAARAQYALPAIVIDFGTATTFDVLDAAGNYTGGIIAPGPHQSLRALTQAAAKLPHVRLTKPAQVLGTDTISAMQSGLYWGYVSLVEGLLMRLMIETGPIQSIIATGGLAKLFEGDLAPLTATDLNLTLNGCRILHDNHRKA